ncbi:MAG: ATP-binding protein [Kiritimatiellae bacterium]|nr:ATP-binding protein [Kiritimatiellia bacterium]
MIIVIFAAILAQGARVMAGVAELRAADPAATPPVHLEAMVSGVYPATDSREFTIADAASPNGAGIYVRAHGAYVEDVTGALAPGDLIELDGKLERGEFAPILHVFHFKRTGRVALPSAPERAFAELAGGAMDSQRARLRGVVQSVETTSLRTVCEIRAQGGVVRIVMPPRDGVEVDCEVEAQGVAGSLFNARGEWIGATLVASAAEDLEIIAPAPEAAPLVALGEIANWANGLDFHRKSVRGTVTFAGKGCIFLQDANAAALKVNLAVGVAPPQRGDEVEATGFAAQGRSFAELSEAVVRTTGKGKEPDAIAIASTPPYRPPSAAEPVMETLDGCLVEIDARLAAVREDSRTMYLDFDGRTVEARLPDGAEMESLAALPAETAVRVRGIYRIAEDVRTVDWEAWNRPIRFELLLRGAEDVALRPDERFIGPIAMRHLKRIGGGVLAALFLLMAVQAALHRLSLLAQARRFREREIAIAAAEEERKRVAADLHDSLQQNLTAAALQLEALAAREAGGGRDALNLAGEILSAARSDVHSIVWKLRNGADEPLASALERDLAAVRRSGMDVRLVASGVPEVSREVAEATRMIVKEALANALRHGKAKSAQVVLGGEEGDFFFSVTDYGCGFDVAAVREAREGHFGLANIEKRVRDLGGTVEIMSAAGRGTRIEARMPPGGRK